MYKRTIFLCLALSVLSVLLIVSECRAQKQIIYAIDADAQGISLPAIFKPGIDLSGRGLHNDITWPQNVAAKEVLDRWQEDIGFRGVYRLQYNLWEISQLGKAKYLQNKLLENYEKIIKAISDAGGTVILDIYGTPAGLGRVLDAKSVPEDVRSYKPLIKNIIRELSCNKRYRIWYEFWNAPDLDEFFLGRKQEYFSLYRTVAEAVKELRRETGIHIPLGAPSISWWSQNTGSNTVATPENSLIYELINYCYRHRLPLDFISWHAYSSDDRVEKELSLYGKKPVVTLIRDWLSYFNFDQSIPLVVDEWNYDRNANVLPERGEDAFITASYIPSRLKHMYEAGINYQIYFCLEDFQNNKEGVVRNVGGFYAESNGTDYQGGPKVIYNCFRMLSLLGERMLARKSADFSDDDFVGFIATKSADKIAVLMYNYVDPEIVHNYISRHIATLRAAERKILLRYIQGGHVDQLLSGDRTLSSLRLTKRMRSLLKKAMELHRQAYTARTSSRTIQFKVKNVKGSYLYQRYAIDSSCSLDCPFEPQEEKVMALAQDYEETITMDPYSVHLIVLQKKEGVAPLIPKEQVTAPVEVPAPVKSEAQVEDAG